MYFRPAAVIGVALLFLAGSWCAAVEDSECFACHGEKDFAVKKPDGQTLSLYIDKDVVDQSMHGPLGCTACHSDITEVPHPEGLKKVNCSECHKEQGDVYAQSTHGKKLAEGDPLAPVCADCHGKHDIKPMDDPTSSVNAIHVPQTCGKCHADNAPVGQSRNIEQHEIIQHYTESIHGEGLLKKGLKVTAVCNSCHTAHSVLPHTDPQSTINRDNVVATCEKCHTLIEQVHRKVINGELWEKDPNKVPICIDCHQPHEARKVFYDEGVSDKDCMACHDKVIQGAKREIPAVDAAELGNSMHKAKRCSQCHTGADPAKARPCETVPEKVDCSICHEIQVQEHASSTHGQLLAKGDPDAPECLDCHSGHGTQSKNDSASPTFSKNVPVLCGKCHRDGEQAAKRLHSTQVDIVGNYTSSIHGKGLLESGLLVTATCTRCHTAHLPLPASDPESSVNPANLPKTCGACHEGVEKTFEKSIHSALVSKTDKPLPVCSTCHTAHTIARTDEEKFREEVLGSCGKCHLDVAETYFDTYHGKVSKLGAGATAKCHDCHGSHDILGVTDPLSHVSRDRIVETCSKCHEGSNRRFAGYLTHATHHDPKKYPILFYTFWSMTALLAGTFAFFGLHTLAWLPRSFRELRRKRKDLGQGDQRLFMRFDPIVRQMHFVLIVCFLGLAVTGMALKFSYMPWALQLSRWLGGFHTMGGIHRTCAVVMIVLFIVHLVVVVEHKRRGGLSWFQMFLGTRSLVPNLTDLKEFIQTCKWFLHLGPRPAYGQWTYWEKFDYFAVFWGIAIIGSTGIMLWFPEQMTRVFPGWFINVATIIHSDEALLACGFIFTVHFFNTHFRPEKFPMDMAMFTSRMTVEELAHERPRQYQELVESGELEKHLVPEDAPKEFQFWAILFGNVALLIGFSMVLFILYSMIYGYK